MGQSTEYNQQRIAAISHYLAIQEYQQAADLINPQAEEWIRYGQVAVIGQAIGRLPHALVQQHLGLCIWSSWVHTLIGEEEQAEYWIEQANQRITTSFCVPAAICATHCNSYQNTAGQMLAIRALLAQRQGDRSAALVHANAALVMLPADNTTLRTMAALTCTIAQLDPATPELLINNLHALRRTADATTQPFILISILMHEAVHLLQRGQLSAAFHMSQRALAYAEEEQHAALTSLPQLRLGQIAYLWNDLAAAQHYLALGLATPCAEFGLATIDGYITLARIHSAQGQIGLAAETLHTAEQFAHTCGRHAACERIQAWQARLNLQTGNISAAMHWANRTDCWHTLPDFARFSSASADRWLTFCRLLIILADAPSLQCAEQVLDDLLQHAMQQQYMLIRIETSLVLVHLYCTTGKHNRAIALLADALALLETSSALRLVLEEAPWIRSLVSRFSHSGILSSIANRLLQELPVGSTTADHNALAEPLNLRELAILELVAAGHSNAEIAQQKGLAISTIQWYLKQVYRKLHVHNRTQAAIRARDLNLLSSSFPQFGG